jgi:hypothetical protein
MVPESGWSVPEATFIRVDLPAPFSPRSACISPARTSNETSCSAATLAKLFEIFERIKGERDIYAPFSSDYYILLRRNQIGYFT